MTIEPDAYLVSEAADRAFVVFLAFLWILLLVSKVKR